MTTPVVDLRLWRIHPSDLLGAVGRVALHRYSLRGTAGLTFVKLLGTGTGRTFTPRDADPQHWALLTVFENIGAAQRFDSQSPQLSSWRRIAKEQLHVRMSPLASTGLWSGRAPFPVSDPTRWDGPVAAITRARIKFLLSRKFWSAVPPVIADLHGQPGLVCAFGIGEAPIGLQGTFSMWRSNRELSDFAYRGHAHREAIDATERLDWYAEELFARFAVLHVEGTWRGQSLLAALS